MPEIAAEEPAGARVETARAGGAWLAAPFLVALTLRLAAWRYILSVGPGGLFSNDSAQFVTLADELLAGEFKSFLRVPGYPLFLAMGKALFADWPAALSLLQSVLDGATASLAAWIAAWLAGSRRAGLAAGLVYAASPIALVMAHQMLSEALFASLFTAAVLLFLVGLRTSNRIALGGSALLVGLSCLVRPIGVFLPVILAIFVLAPRGEALRRRVAGAVLFLLIAEAPIVAWCARNQAVHGRWALTNAVDLAYFRFEGPAAMALAEHPGPILRMWAEGVTPKPIWDELGPYQARLDQALLARPDWRFGEDIRSTMWANAEASAIFGEVGKSAVLEHPIGFLVSRVGGALSLLLRAGPPRFDWLCRQFLEWWPVAWVVDLAATLLFFVGVGFALLSRRLRARLGLPAAVLLGIVLYFVAVPGVRAEARFKAPALPFIAVGAGIAALRLSRRRGEG